jgi:hypothetical protein
VGTASRFAAGMLTSVRVSSVAAVIAVGAGRSSVGLGWWRRLIRSLPGLSKEYCTREKCSRPLCRLNFGIASLLAAVLLVDNAVDFLRTSDLHAILSHSNGNSTLSGASTDQDTNTRSVHYTKCKLAPDSGFQKSMLPFQARHNVV